MELIIAAIPDVLAWDLVEGRVKLVGLLEQVFLEEEICLDRGEGADTGRERGCCNQFRQHFSNS